LSSPSQILHPISKFDGQLLSSALQLSITLLSSGFIVISPPVDEERVDLMQWNGMGGILFSFLARSLASHDLCAFVVFVMQGGNPTMEDHLIVSVVCKVNDKGVWEARKAFRLKTIDDVSWLWNNHWAISLQKMLIPTASSV
jgi:hypothetical protein